MPVFGIKNANVRRFAQKRAAGLNIFGRKAVNTLANHGGTIAAGFELAGAGLVASGIGAPLGAAFEGVGEGIAAASMAAKGVKYAKSDYGLEK
jgi:hypothetical protein